MARNRNAEAWAAANAAPTPTTTYRGAMRTCAQVLALLDRLPCPGPDSLADFYRNGARTDLVCLLGWYGEWATQEGEPE